MTTFKNFVERHYIAGLDMFIKEPYKVEYSKEIRSKMKLKILNLNKNFIK